MYIRTTLLLLFIGVVKRHNVKRLDAFISFHLSIVNRLSRNEPFAFSFFAAATHIWLFSSNESAEIIIYLLNILWFDTASVIFWALNDGFGVEWEKGCIFECSSIMFKQLNCFRISFHLLIVDDVFACAAQSKCGCSRHM